jgi:hypothetical protein
MPVPLIWAGVALAGVFGVGWAAKEGGEAMDSATRLTKWTVVAGGMYVSYKALQSSGAIK